MTPANMIEETKLVYRSREARWSPHNRATREQRKREAQFRAGEKRDAREADKAALKLAAAAAMQTPEMLARKAAALADAERLLAALGIPRPSPLVVAHC